MTTATNSSIGWTGLETEWNRLHLSHLFLPLGFPSMTVEELLRRIDETHALGAPDHLTLGLNALGSHELLIHPNKDFVTLVLTFQKQPFSALTLEIASRLMPIIGNNGCGPDSPAALLTDLEVTRHIATVLQRPVSHTYASLCDVLLFPDGQWLIYGDGGRSSVKLIRHERDSLPLYARQ